MGLDISAYTEMKKMDCLFDEDGEPTDPVTRRQLDFGEYVRVYANADFVGREDDLEHKQIYSFENSKHLAAGPYSAYNRWRNDLAKLAGYPLGSYEQYGRKWPTYCQACWEGEEGPFSELINFSDCEGTIGSKTSKKLAADFASFQGKADGHSCQEFREKYSEWRKLFEYASNSGCVRFH